MTTTRRLGCILGMVAIIAACGEQGGELAEERQRRRAEQALRDSLAGESARAAVATPRDSAFDLPAFIGDSAGPGAPIVTTDTVPAAQPQEEWTVGSREGQGGARGLVTLRDVRLGMNAGFDRVVMDFGNDPVPAYHVEYVDRPVRQCGSGDPVPVAGDAWLLIRLDMTQAHDDEGRATVRSLGQPLRFSALREWRLICDFEGVVEIVLGVASPNPYRVTTESGPTRLIVDVRQ